MAALPQEFPGERDNRAVTPWLAIAGCLGAALAFAGVGAAVRYLGGNPIGMIAGACVMGIAGVLLLGPRARAGALLLAWNGLGIALGLFVVGIFSVGALMAFPLVLIALALSSWPRDDGETIASLPAIVSQVGGFVLVFLLYGLDDLARLAGL
jgi:hypothetical protein